MEALKYKIMMDEQHEVTIKPITAQEEKQEGIKIYEEEDPYVELVILEIEIDGYFLIYYHYYPFLAGLQNFTIYIRKNIIFLGGVRQSCTVNMLKSEVENKFDHCLFWDFEEMDNGLVLESGELDCLLRDSEGKIIDKTYVEPPYEVFFEEDRIRFEFESPIAGGRTYLNLRKP